MVKLTQAMKEPKIIISC